MDKDILLPFWTPVLPLSLYHKRLGSLEMYITTYGIHWFIGIYLDTDHHKLARYVYHIVSS